MPQPYDNTVWWDQYVDIARHFIHYVEHESKAKAIRMFCANFFPGLLQSQNYALANLYSYYRPEIQPSNLIDRHLALRQKRQRVFMQRQTPLTIVVAEQALYKKIGSTETLREQLLYIHRLSELPHITFRILPLECGGPGITLQTQYYSLLSLEQEILYLDDGCTTTTNRREVDYYDQSFYEILQLCYTPKKSRDLLKKRANELLAA